MATPLRYKQLAPRLSSGVRAAPSLILGRGGLERPSRFQLYETKNRRSIHDLRPIDALGVQEFSAT